MGNGDDVHVEGIGHPNIILYADYAVLNKNRQPTWYLKVETYVDIEDNQLQMVKDGLSHAPTTPIPQLVAYLHRRVPATGSNPEASKHMIAAAFDVPYP